MARHATAYWREQHKAGNLLNGRLINTSSDSGLLGNAGQGNYGTAKAAVAALAIIVDREMAATDAPPTQSRRSRAPA